MLVKKHKNTEQKNRYGINLRLNMTLANNFKFKLCAYIHMYDHKHKPVNIHVYRITFVVLLELCIQVI